MRKQSRKTLSLLLIGVLLFLGYSAELAHINCLVDTGTSQHLATHRPEESSPIGESLTTLCPACAFHSSHLAIHQTSLTAVRLVPAGEFLEIAIPIHLQNQTSYYALRAPPLAA